MDPSEERAAEIVGQIYSFFNRISVFFNRKFSDVTNSGFCITCNQIMENGDVFIVYVLCIFLQLITRVVFWNALGIFWTLFHLIAFDFLIFAIEWRIVQYLGKVETAVDERTRGAMGALFLLLASLISFIWDLITMGSLQGADESKHVPHFFFRMMFDIIVLLLIFYMCIPMVKNMQAAAAWWTRVYKRMREKVKRDN